ncbi:MAG: type I restriction endonuclease subunit S [Neptuniibacter caesariensis]|uniref:Type I restriction endonuclease subunit S n=1 Tax=Neptuniibacter caesariensis TaxID=207954 RepID=A0A2G6JBD1_NEPCE|nr:MAG: type I restriction endonuclease subunit S [Neptuniibacter caesariensis]
MKLAVYPKYKPSEKDWLYQIPEHWKEKRVKFSLSYIGSGKTPKGGANVYVNEGISLFRSQNVHDSGMRLDDVVHITDEADALQAGSRVKEHDVLLNITGASIGRTSVVTAKVLPANVNQHVCILRTEQEKILSSYLHRLLCSKIAKDQVLENENGTSREGLNFVQVANLFFPLPPIHEQTQITKFLDYKTAQIDRLIEKKKALIEKLGEQRIALITQAVTKGLNPDAPMKDSGVAWLGEVPKHWEVLSIKRLTPVKRGASPRPIQDPKYFDDDGEYSWVRIADVTANDHYLVNTYQTLSELGRSLSVPLEPGRLFLSIAGSVGKPMITKIKCCIHDGFVYFPYYDHSQEFLYYIFYCGQPYLGLGKLGTQLNLNTDTVGDIKIGLPPIQEQEKIVEYLHVKTKKIDRMCYAINSAIEKLNEYRTALITAAVTGKIDVRHWKPAHE